MADQISNIIDNKVFTDLDTLVTKIESVEKEIDVVNGKAISIQVDLKGAESLTQLTAAIKDQKVTIDQLTQSEQQNTAATIQLVSAQEKFGLGTAALAEKLADQKLEMDYVNKQIKAYTEIQNVAGKATLENFQILGQYIERQKVLRQEINQTTAEIKTQTEIGLNKQAEAFAKLGRQMGNAMNTTSGVREAMRQLALQGKQNSIEYKVLQERAIELSNAQKKVVADTTAATKSISFLGVEVKNVDQMFARMALRMVGSFVVFNLLFEGVTKLYEAFTALSDAEKLAEDNLTAYNDAVKELEKSKSNLTSNVFSGININKDEASEALKIANDQNKSLQERISAYKQLQGIVPGVLKSLTDEQKKTGDFAVSQKQLNEAIIAQNALLQQRQILEQANKAVAQGDVQIEALKKKELQSQTTNFQGLVVHNTSDMNAVVKAEAQQAQVRKDLANAQVAYNRAFAEWNRLQVDDTKDKKGAKPNAKDMNAELEAAKRVYELQLQINKQKFDESNKTFTEQKQHIDENKEAAKEYANAVEVIVEKWKGKTGESLDKFIARLGDNTKFLLEQLNKAKEADDKLQQSIIEGHIKANEESQKYIENLRQQRLEVEKLMQDLDEIEQNAKSSHEYAAGLGGFLEGFGINSSKFKESQRQHDIAIDAQKERLGLARETYAAEGLKGSSANPIELGKLKNDAIKEEITLKKLEADKQAEIDNKIVESKRLASEKIVELVQKTYESIRTIQDNQFARELQQINIQQEKLRISTEQKLQSIDATTSFEISKTNQKAKVVAQTQAEENRLQQESNQLNLKKAKADKQAAELAILVNTATAIMKVWADFGYPAAIPLSAIIAGIGVAEYNAAESAPLPQYEEGGTTSQPFFIAAEGNKAELAVTPSGEMSLLTKEGVYNKPVGTRIFNNEDTVQMIEYARKNVLSGGSDMGIMQQIYNNEYVLKEVAKIIAKEYKDGTTEVVSAIYNARPQKDNSVADAMREMSNLQSKRK